MLNLVSYTVPDYEARWIDVVVLERVAEIVAQEINAGAGIDAVSAEALKDVTTTSLLGEHAADTAAAVVLSEQTGEVAVVGTQISDESRDTLLQGMGLDAAVIDQAAHELIRRELEPVQEAEMLQSAAQADAEGGVSSLSATLVAKVAAQMGVGGVGRSGAAAPQDAAPGPAAATADDTHALESVAAVAAVLDKSPVLVVVAEPALAQVAAEARQAAAQDQPATSVLQEVIQLAVLPPTLPAPAVEPESTASPDPSKASSVPEGWRAVIKRVLVWVPVVRLYMRSESNDALPDAQGKAQSAYGQEEGKDDAAHKSRLRQEWLRAEERVAQASEALRPLNPAPFID